MLLLVNLALAQSTWRSLYYDVDHDEDIGLGNQLLNTEFWLTAGYCDASDNANAIYIGNLDNNPNNREMLLHCNDAFMMFNMTLFELNHISSTSISENAVQLYDYDGDAVDEIIGVGGTTIYIYDYDADDDNWSIDKSYVYGANLGSFACYEGFCYIQDQYANLLKYNPTTNTIVDAINEGQTGACSRVTIDECNSQIAGKEIVWMLDEDGDGNCDDIGMVGLSFTGEKFYNDIGGSSAWSNEVDEIECATDGSGTYIGRYAGSSIYTGASCGFYDDRSLDQYFSVHKINSSDQLELVLWKIFTYLGSTFSGVSTGGLGGDLEFVDFHEDGDLDVCLAYSTIGRISCNGATTYSYTSSCHNLSGTNIGGVSLGFNSADPDFQFPVESYVMDIDNDGSDEWFFGGRYINLDTGTTVDMNPVRDATNQVFSNFGGFCLNQYWSVDDTIYADLSGSTCTYDGDSFNVTGTQIVSINYTPVGEGIPPIPTINLNLEDTISVDAYAVDNEADPIYWAFDCEYSSFGIDIPVRTVNDIFNITENETEVQETYHLTNLTDNSSQSPFNPHCEAGEFSLVQFGAWDVWNVTASTCQISHPNSVFLDREYRAGFGLGGMGFFRNLTDDGSPITNEYVTLQLLAGSGFLTGGGVQTLWMGAMDDTRTLNISNQTVYLLDETRTIAELYLVWEDGSGNGSIYRSITGQTEMEQLWNFKVAGDYELVAMDLDFVEQKYRIRVDDNYTATYEYQSDWYDFLNGNHNDVIRAGFVTGAGGNGGTLFMDLLLVDYVDRPQFDSQPNSNYDYECVYDTIGQRTIRTWVTDDFENPDYNSYVSQLVNVVQQGTGTGGVNCTGYAPQTCTGTCWFTDNFDHTYSMACNNWDGADDKTPLNNVAHLDQVGMSGLSMYTNHILSGRVPIRSEEYGTFTIDFDFYLNDSSRVVFSVLDEDYAKYSLYAYFENYNLYTVDYAVPTLVNHGSFTPNTWHTFRAIVDFANDEIEIIIDASTNTSKTIQFFDTDVESASGYYFTLVQFNQADISIDDFLVSYGDPNPVFTGFEEEDVEYVYDSSLFCAINWSTNGTDRFVEQNCVDRGYNTGYPLISLCVPRACLSDVGSLLFSSATRNIFYTMVIVVIFILIAPLIFRRR